MNYNVRHIYRYFLLNYKKIPNIILNTGECLPSTAQKEPNFFYETGGWAYMSTSFYNFVAKYYLTK